MYAFFLLVALVIWIVVGFLLYEREVKLNEEKKEEEKQSLFIFKIIFHIGMAVLILFLMGQERGY